MEQHSDSRPRASTATGQDPAASALDDGEVPTFAPVALKQRHDGWTPARQIAFVQALADTACVTEACERVGKSPRSAYSLRRRPGSASFREAWDVALDYAISRLADAALGRAVNGVATPIFYKGEQIGERRRYDERLTTFLLRYRDPVRFGKWNDKMIASRDHPDGAAWLLTQAIGRVAEDGKADAAGSPRPRRAPLRRVRLLDDPAEIEREEQEAARREEDKREREFQTYIETATAETDARGDFRGDVA